MKFLKIGESLVNLDHVQLVQYEKHSGTSYLYIYSDANENNPVTILFVTDKQADDVWNYMKRMNTVVLDTAGVEE